jgi:hypothetical protein
MGDLADLQRRVRLQNATTLLECTDGELRQMIHNAHPEIGAAELNSMHKEELVACMLGVEN